MYSLKIVATLPELNERLIAAVATFTPDLLNSKWTEIECRYDIFRAAHMASVEYVYQKFDLYSNTFSFHTSAF
jgi:hypothetical protein